MTRTVTGRLPGARPPEVGGRISIPASKSHTIRALLIAAYAGGESRLRKPLLSLDASSCRKAVEALGAKVTDDGEDWVVQGFGGRPRRILVHPAGSPLTIDVGNSGTTLYLAAALAALADFPVRFDGDEQIRKALRGPPALGPGGSGSPGGIRSRRVRALHGDRPAEARHG